MRSALTLIGPILALAMLSACKPPPTDADLAREGPIAGQNFASDPLPSPDTKGAVWAPSSEAGRIIYGIPGQPALMALACLDAGTQVPRIRITRIAPADEDAGAMLALVGNGHIGRIEVDATKVAGRSMWQGESLAADIAWEPLAGPRHLTATVPGAGMVTINPGALPGLLIDSCRNGEAFSKPAP